MRSSTLKDLIILLIMGAALFIAGYFVVLKIQESDLDLSYEVSIGQEEKLGDLFKEIIWDQYPTMNDNAADTALQQITQRLVKALDTTKYKYQFTIIKK